YRSTNWSHSLRIVVYPINGDGSEAADQYIAQLTQDTFTPVEVFLAGEAADYGVPLEKPVITTLGPQIQELPPIPPADRKVLKVMWWSLKMRYWVFRVDEYQGPPADIRMFVVYHDPETHDRLQHSLGLEKGLIGVVNAYAGKKLEHKNNIVLVHEFLHTVGATDKYDLQTGAPLYPDGIVEPDKQPLYPQSYAEIMAGVIPVADGTWLMPDKLDDTIIGRKTAFEINWISQQQE
ncbi:MAG TPA: hypothetical protein VIM41_06375, partial [Gammaproteobacteria bacterium]